MNTSHKVGLLKAVFILWHLLFILTAVKAWSCPTKECGEIPFSTEVIGYEKVEDCYHVTLEVTNNGEARYELSHVNFYFSCGSIDNYSNTEGWKMEPVYRNHKAIGIKVDDIANFGKDPELASFQVEFTYCPYSSGEGDCKDDYYCQPKVLYKAGQCIYTEKLDTDEDTPVLPLSYQVNATSPSCENNDGMIEITITEGIEPFEIVWSNGATGNLIEGLSEGLYTFTITDGNGNEVSEEVILESPEMLDIEGIVGNPQCQGTNDGSVELSVTGGVAPYSFKWSDGSENQTLSGVAAGNYSVMVTDANNCSNEATFTLTNTTALSLETVVNQPSCQEGTLGSISLSPSGGTEPYSYTWSNGAEEASIDGLQDGYYRVTITDQNGCQFNRTIPIVTEIGIDVMATTTKANCFDDPVGAIDLTIIGGTEPITVEWSNGETTEDISDLTSGNYTATITDALGCQKIFATSVLKDDIKVSYNAITIPSCSGSTDGAIDISVSNGTEPYTYEWSTGDATEDIDNLAAGKYDLTITDGAGCSIQKSINLPAPNPIVIDHEIVGDVCTGSQSIIVGATGGSSNYTYVWSDGSTGIELTDATPGSYTVTVTDGNQCSESKTIAVGEMTSELSCTIAELTDEIVCGSTSNIIQSTTTDAISYHWSLTSSDPGWQLSSSADQASVAFSAGGAGSSATFSLTLGFEGGCEITCEKVIEVCIDNNDPDNPNDDPNDDDPGNDSGDPTDDDDNSDNPDCPDGGDNSEPNGNKECDECFFTNPVSISRTYGGYLYTIEVSHGDCNYDLSHLTIEIPECFKIINYSNSMNWEMGIVKNDPTTGLNGIKIDDIPAFGKDGTSSFEISLTLTSYDNECMDDLKCFTPVIAYKAATCVYEETTQGECLEEEEAETGVSTYPNPTCDRIKVYKKAWDRNASYSADLLGSHGEKIKSFHFEKGFAGDFDIDLSSCKEGLYLLQLRSSNGDCSTHRVIKN
jgi:hypothetical protein